MERRLTTIVAADLAGYSRLMADDEEGTLARLAAARADLIDPELTAAGARIVKTMGDGLLAEFPSPVAALRACLAIQRAMVAREAEEPESRRLRFRIGINLGDVIAEDGDLFGDAINIAARLESLAPPGGICIGRAVHDQLRGKIDAPMTALGAQAVKNIPDPVEVWRVEIAGVADPDFALPHQLFARWYFYHLITGRAGTLRNDYLREGLNHAEAAIRLDNHLDLGFIGKGLLLSVAGRVREAREALDRAESLNPNNHLLWFARGVWQQYQEEPDADEWERACRMGLKLSPKDPLQWMHYFYLGWANLLRHRDFAHPDVRAAMETGAGLPEASFHVHFCAALSCLECGDMDEARRHVARGLEVNPDISLASWFQYDGPTWPRMFTGPEVRARLVPLGLPER